MKGSEAAIAAIVVIVIIAAAMVIHRGGYGPGPGENRVTGQNEVSIQGFDH